MFIKKNVHYQEYTIHNQVNELKINSPKIHDYNIKTSTLTMEEIPQMCISDMYGEESKDVPYYIFDEIRKIIKKLYENKIYYPDITGYNFIEYQDKIWIIDFGDAKFITKETELSPFVLDFINGLNKWNPEFK